MVSINILKEKFFDISFVKFSIFGFTLNEFSKVSINLLKVESSYTFLASYKITSLVFIKKSNLYIVNRSVLFVIRLLAVSRNFRK